LQIGIHNFPHDSWPLYECAMLAHDQSDWPEAVRRWEALRQAYPDRWEGYARGADALVACGRVQEAEELRADQTRRFPH
jgi:hypothetical protein